MATKLKQDTKKRLQGLQAYALAKKKHKKFIMPTITLKAIINRSLEDFIKGRMQSAASPASKAYLRLQTGRFAESARLLTLNRQETGAYFGVYTFMHNPYSLFEPGNSGLASPGRDPKLYIEGAAREIALQVLKKRFKGLIMEAR